MKLSQLIADCNVISIKGNENVEVMGITSDFVRCGRVAFVAVEGICTDGHSYIGKAIEEGAGVVYDKPLIEEFFSRVTYVQVENSAIALALIASQWYDNPSGILNLSGLPAQMGKPR